MFCVVALYVDISIKWSALYCVSWCIRLCRRRGITIINEPYYLAAVRALSVAVEFIGLFGEEAPRPLKVDTI